MMEKPKKTPIFYCDNCGKEVPYNAEICPSCRLSFQAVMCPQCHYVNESHFFSRGCPVCGHMAPAMSFQRENRGRGSSKVSRGDLRFFLILPILILLFILTAYLYLRV